MNHFGIDITGKTGVYKSKSFWKPKASVAERTFTCIAGSGCSPLPGTSNKVEVLWKSDGLVENISSSAIEMLLDKGEEIHPLPDEPAVEVFNAGDVPVKEEPPVRVRRKK